MSMRRKGASTALANRSPSDRTIRFFPRTRISRIIVAYKNGAPIRLGNIANVIDSVENDQLGAWVSNRNGEQPAVLLDIQRQPGANIIQTVERVKQLLPRLTSTLPPSVHVEVLADRTETIRASFSDVQFTLLLTIALVVMVMFLFLRKLWTTVITSVALPLSLIGTFGIMYLAGFSLDNLSLMALTISTGFVVDDAIVMIENIVRYIEAGDAPLEAALKGAKQIGFTVVSLSVSLVAVFIPLLFMTGIVGRLFREFAITLSVAVGVSAFVSLTLTPMMCAKLLRSESEDEQEHAGEFYRRTEEYWTRFRDWYERGLRWVLRASTFRLDVALVTLVATILLYIIVPKGLLPQQDTGVIVGVTDAAENISFKAMMERVHAVSEIVRQDPDVASVSASVGAGTVNATVNTARLYIVLKPHNQRANAEKIIERLRERDAQRRRNFALHASGAGSANRCQDQSHPIPIHPAGCRRGRTGGLDAETRAETRATAATERCGKRSADQRLATECRR